MADDRAHSTQPSGGKKRTVAPSEIKVALRDGRILLADGSVVSRDAIVVRKRRDQEEHRTGLRARTDAYQALLTDGLRRMLVLGLEVERRERTGSQIGPGMPGRPSMLADRHEALCHIACLLLLFPDLKVRRAATVTAKKYFPGVWSQLNGKQTENGSEIEWLRRAWRHVPPDVERHAERLLIRTASSQCAAADSGPPSLEEALELLRAEWVSPDLLPKLPLA